MVYQFKIKIEGLSKPPVWRKLEVPAQFNFEQFHKVIQIAFGWSNSHLWRFEPRGKGRQDFCIVNPYDYQETDHGDEFVLAEEIKLSKVFDKMDELVYVYDYGDDWRHLIKLEGIIDAERDCALCVKGKGSTPPEDCGGVPGYELIKDIFAGNDEERKQEYRQWIGLLDDMDWDPDFFCEEEFNDINIDLLGISARKANSDSPVYMSIQDLLKCKKVPELRELAIRLGCKFKSGVKKADMLDFLADRMVRRPEKIIESAYGYELKAFLDIINGNVSAEYAEQSGLAFELNRYGLIYILDYRFEKTSTVHFQMDVAQALAPLIPAELERRERDGSLLFERIALGCANLYGYAEVGYIASFVDEVEERTGRVIDDDELNNVLYPVIVDVEINNDQSDMLMSPFAPQVHFYPDDEHIDLSIPPKEFDFDTVLKYGEMPYPHFIGKEADAFRREIVKHGVDPDPILREVWLDHQDGSTFALKRCMELFIFAERDIQPFIDAMANFRNNQPCWKLGGNSSMEVVRRSRPVFRGKPNITIGPNLRAMGITSYEQIEEMARRGEEFPPMPSTKLGRNDPCPCGSGKKYKHCCGR